MRDSNQIFVWSCSKKAKFLKPGKGRGGSRRRAASSDDDDESGSDWERSASRKPARKSKPAKRTPASRKSARARPTKKKASDSEDEEQMELSDVEDEKVERKMCKKNCGRRNPAHLKQFAHPGESGLRLVGFKS